MPLASPLARGRPSEQALVLLCRSLPAGLVLHCFAFLSFFFSLSPTRFLASLSFEEDSVLSEFRRCSGWLSGSVDVSLGVSVGEGEL